MLSHRSHAIISRSLDSIGKYFYGNYNKRVYKHTRARAHTRYIVCMWMWMWICLYIGFIPYHKSASVCEFINAVTFTIDAEAEADAHDVVAVLLWLPYLLLLVRIQVCKYMLTNYCIKIYLSRRRNEVGESESERAREIEACSFILCVKRHYTTCL